MKLPMIRAGLLALRGQTKAPVKKDFDQALHFLRKASGKPEYRHVPLRCAVYDRPFVVIYRRDDPDARFRIDKISKDVPALAANGGKNGRPLASGHDSLTAYNNKEFNSAGRYCPWCQDRGTVHCEDCGETYCGGSVTESSNGVRIYQCVPRCGSNGDLTDYDKMHGSRAMPPLQKPQTPLLAKGKKRALPPPKRPLLPGW